ncbi:uncharacterized protein [Diabrotica undecimpunctata]|uniref:uncharacterized protein n=1 Tax=Diabrotica undecimpunctata TaxID=50387 RepID=UPI003B636060
MSDSCNISQDAIKSVNSTLLQNQSFLYKENIKLQDDIVRLSQQLEEIRSLKMNDDLFQYFQKEKENLLTLNNTLRENIRHLKTPSKFGDNEAKNELRDTVYQLDKIIEKVRRNDKFEIKPQKNNTGEVITSLTKKLEEEERKYEESNEALRKLREDDEKYMLREKILDMKQLLTDLEVENTKLKYENEQLLQDIEHYKKQLDEALEETKATAKQCCALDDEKELLKKTISNLENERIRIKKAMIEEMNEANRAKRVSVDTEIALQHISEAYENKRKEIKSLMEQLEDAENIIKEFKQQINIPIL